MSNANPWHLQQKKSWWDGTVTTWCGLSLKSGERESDFWYLPRTGPSCPACKAAKKNQRR